LQSKDEECHLIDVLDDLDNPYLKYKDWIITPYGLFTRHIG